MSMFIGEALAGDGNEVAHIDLLIGSKDGPVGVAFAYWMAAVRADSWEERTHLLEYGIVAALIHQALLERRGNGRPVPRPAATAVVATALLGLLDECIQAMLADSVAELWGARLMTFETAAAHDRGDDLKSLHARCSLAKLTASSSARRCSASRPMLAWSSATAKSPRLCNRSLSTC